MAASNTSIEDFLSGPLVAWLSTCVKKPEALQVYETFFDGSPISEVFLQIDPEPQKPVPSLSNFHGVNLTFARIKVFDSIIQNIRSIYEEELGQTIVSLPDCVTLGRTPGSEVALEHLKLLILLLLGCAVQGPTKERFILKIKELSLDTQHEIVRCIQQVTEEQNIVLTLDHSEQNPAKMFSHIQNLTAERERILHQWLLDLGQEFSVKPGTAEVVEKNHLAVEIADWKARLRKQRQELEEKSEILTECREELEHATALVSKLKAENSDLTLEARKAKLFQDEIDAMREKVERADRLETEAQRYRERLADAEFYKVRVDELREDNRVLMETREMLEAQLARARQRADYVLDLEAELLSAKQNLNEIALERDAAKERVQELVEENLQLQHVAKSMLQETNLSLSDEEEEVNSGDNSLSEQLTNNAQARALKLELENKKLLSTIESLKEQKLHENANRLLDLEKEKKRLTLKCEQLQENCDRLKRQNDELESLFKNAIQENRKLQENVEGTRTTCDRQIQELQNERTKNVELEKEKQRVQVLCESIKKRADDAEKSLAQVSDKLQETQRNCTRFEAMEEEREERSERIAGLEKENATLNKDLTRFKETVESKDVQLDEEIEKVKRRDRDLERLLKENENLCAQLDKLQEFERKTRELQLQASMHEETISALQKNLINEKFNKDKCRHCEKTEFVGVQDENAKLQVDVATLKSQLHTLQTQQTALQLANSQLVAEKEDLAKQQKVQKGHHDTVLVDQMTMRKLHEQLTVEYEHLKGEQEGLKRGNREARSELRALKETHGAQKERIATLETEREALKGDAKNLSVLRAEHSKLKDDFRNLFTASDRLKVEYRNIQEELKKVRTESRSLRLGHTEMQGELNSTSDLAAGLHLENARLQQKCDMLFEMNHSLDADRRALMDHVSQLLTQYHSLLTHSLEDKQQFHNEEKVYTDKVNNLCRQKEKLEEKIMEHYRKLDSASCKKRGFGATLVRRVRKAGSDIISKVPTRNRRSWHEGVSSGRMSQSQFTLAGSDSDNSVEDATTPRRQDKEEVTLRKPCRNSVDGGEEREPDASLSLGSVGSRRTVYLSEDETAAAPPPPAQPPLLVYNRISTVLNSAKEAPERTNDIKDGDAKESAVWYEYGCV